MPSESSSTFSRRSRSGAITSRIDSQDSVAACLIVEALCGNLKGVPSANEDPNVVVFCEGREDIEFTWEHGLLLVSVKDTPLAMNVLRAELEKLQVFLSSAEKKYIAFQICALQGCDATSRSFLEDLVHLKDRLRLSSDADSATEFASKWGVELAPALALTVDTRDLSRDSKSAEANFAHAMRIAYPVLSCTETMIDMVYRYLTDEMLAPARRHRAGIHLQTISRHIASRLAPAELLRYEIEYVSTPFGYIKDSVREERIRNERKLVKSSARRAMKTWRRHTAIERLTVGHVCCLVCNHPMVANFNGLSGVACPDCGYQPFMSLFYSCDCGEPISLASQPDLDGPGLFAQALESIRTKQPNCGSCNVPVDSRKLSSRMFLLPIPWPLTGSIDGQLIAMRELMGRPQCKFEDIDEAKQWLISEGRSIAMPPAPIRRSWTREMVVYAILNACTIIGLLIGIYWYLLR